MVQEVRKAVHFMEISPAEAIARNWYKELDLVYEGVNFGECITYDVLQIVNRLILEHKAKNAPDTPNNQQS